MKKVALLLACVMLIVLAFAACSEQIDEIPEDPTKTVNPPSGDKTPEPADPGTTPTPDPDPDPQPPAVTAPDDVLGFLRDELKANVVAYWSFNENTRSDGGDYTKFEDISGNGNYLMAEPGIAYVDGYSGKALQLAGYQSVLAFENTSLCRFADSREDQKITVSFVLRVDNKPADSGIYFHYNYGGVDFSFGYFSIPAGSAARMFGVSRQYNMSFTGEWNLYTFVFDGSVEFPECVMVYRDGFDCMNRTQPANTDRFDEKNNWDYPADYEYFTGLIFNSNGKGAPKPLNTSVAKFDYSISDLFILNGALSAGEAERLAKAYGF